MDGGIESALRTQAAVIIVGGGPVGLGAALELARFGVRSVLIERHAGTSWHPKTRNFNTRTMEIAIGWGPAVYGRLRSIDTPDGWKSPIRFLHSAVGEEFGSIESKGFEGPGPDVSPAMPVMSSQELIEEILLDAARVSGLVDVRYSTEAVELVRGGAHGDDDVALRVRSLTTGVEDVLVGLALVGADGASSTIRDELGVHLDGVRDLLHLCNCYFRADIEAHLGDRRGVLFFINNDRATGVLQPLDGAGRWLCQISVQPDEWSADVFTAERAHEWIRGAVGIDDLDVDIVSIGFWKLNSTVAQRFVQGRVVLCGDAAHQFPPTGGLGVNTGLQGMHNAMWKLAWFVLGHASWDLVETYDDERRAPAQEVTNQSLENSANVARINAAAASGDSSGLSTEEVFVASRRYGNHLGVELGARYTSMAVVPDGTDPPTVEDSYADYSPSATPGCRAPHQWIGRRDANLSTLHLFGPNLTLLAGPDGADWCAAAVRVTEELVVPIDHYRLGAAGLHDGRALDEYGLDADGAVLVRPDGYVAWRSRSGPASPELLRSVVKTILGLTNLD